MNRQDIYNKVAAHLLAQNCRSSDKYSCLYRSDEGLKCAIGCIIPDEVYDPMMEGKPASTIAREYSLFEVESRSDLYFLDDLQAIHDHHSVGTWRYMLREFASIVWDLEPIA